MDWSRYTQYDKKFMYATKSCRVLYKCPSAYLSLDPMTIHNMELVRNIRSGAAKESLFGVLNHCKTSMGQACVHPSCAPTPSLLFTPPWYCCRRR